MRRKAGHLALLLISACVMGCQKSDAPLSARVEQLEQTVQAQDREIDKLRESLANLAELKKAVAEIEEDRESVTSEETVTVKILNAERFNVVDKDGRTRAVLGLEDRGYNRIWGVQEGESAFLALYDQSTTKALAKLTVGSGPCLFLCDEDMQAFVSLGVSRTLVSPTPGVKPNAESNVDWWEWRPEIEFATRPQRAAPASQKAGDKAQHVNLFGEPESPLSEEFWHSPRLTLTGGSSPRIEIYSKGLSDLVGDSDLYGYQYPGIHIYDRGGIRRASVGLTAEESLPFVTLKDGDGQTRATLGWTVLETRKTGEETHRPASSLVLFDKEGNVIWQAPP